MTHDASRYSGYASPERGTGLHEPMLRLLQVVPALVCGSSILIFSTRHVSTTLCSREQPHHILSSVGIIPPGV